MKNFFFLLTVLSLLALHSCGQATINSNQPGPGKDIKVGGPCEGCEAIYECPVPFDSLMMFAWLPDWDPNIPRIAINGTVYNPDGTPAPGVIIYIYHTDQKGVYPTKGDEKGWAKRHGYLRGWMKTNEKGEYKFFTRRPVSYPGSKNPQHIHVTIKEPGKSEYWIDEYLFDDDPYLTAEERKKCPGRGGSGILKIPDHYKGRDILKAERDIYLGKNIPDYPGS
jgi:protocatechuate 3,4-dioxygenase beta subunit